MEESPKKPTSSRVIDSLHQEIDKLKSELETVKISNSSYKKKSEILTVKNESYVDQLANAKHENDMINALLKRKERRILDLENEYNDILSNNENLKLTNKNMKIRCDNLQESSTQNTAEYERLKIAYDALTASQVEYKRHYEGEVSKITSSFVEFKREYIAKYESLSQNFNNNDKDIDILLDGLTNKRKTLDNLYFNKNKMILELLTKLATISKIHGQESKQILQDNLINLNLLIEKHPDLQLRINSDDTNINLEELLSESSDIANSSFDEEATLIEEPKVSRSNTFKRNGSNGSSKKFGKNHKWDERARTPTPPNNSHEKFKSVNNISHNRSQSNSGTNNNNNTNHSNNNNNHHNKSKRRSTYGNNFKNIPISS